MTNQATAIQRPRKKVTKAQNISSPLKQLLNAIQKYTDTTWYLLGCWALHTHTYSYPASCRVSPDFVSLHMELLCWPNKGRSLLDQISLPLPHHLNCSQDPCVTQLGMAARSPSELLQESYYLHHHGLSDVRSRRNNLNKKKWRKLRRQLLHIEYSPLSWGK